MDPHRPAKRQRPSSARQRRTANSSSARMRHTQQPSGGGVSSNNKHADESNARVDAGAETRERATSASAALRDRLQSSATATMNVVGERVRRASEFSHRAKDPLARPTTWLMEPSWYERFHNWVADVTPFSWRERARRYGFWRRRVLPIIAIIACLAVAVGVGLFALNTAGHAAGAFTGTPNGAQATVGGSVMISPLNNNVDLAPTPPAVQYTVGVWVSNTLPQGGSVTVFVRVSNNSMPQPNARVYVHATTPNGGINIGPLTTDAYGVASAPLNYGNVGSQQPIFLTGSTTIGGKTITGQYTFVTY